MAQMSRLVCITLTTLTLATTAAAQRRPRPATLRCGDVIGFQVLLARQGFSPGVIDGLAGRNLERALAAFQGSRGLTATGNLDCATWDALGGDAAAPTVVPYRITSADASGPFAKEIPASLQEQAALPSLDYTSLTEALAERFHTSPAPPFHYNPDLFWDAKPTDSKAMLKSGPNSPVGVVWIDLDVEHYGIHGTPEPTRVGHAESHGCVRLTNWDAAKLAALVAPGTKVQLR